MNYTRSRSNSGEYMRNDQLIAKEIYNAINLCSKNDAGNICVKKYEENLTMYKFENQFLILIKPESCEIEQVNTSMILQYMIEKFNDKGINIHSCFVINGAHMRENAFIENQYFTLNKGAKYGYERLPLNYQKIVSEKFPNHKIVGAYQFLDMHPEYTIEKLEEIAHEIGSYKVGNGTYILNLSVAGTNYAIINAFHPHQVKHFQKNENVTVILECLSNLDYSELCDEVIGDFRPACAKGGSLRNYIYTHRAELNFSKVGTLYNGFHISPSPLEAMWAIDRYCIPVQYPINYDRFNIGKRLLASGCTPECLDSIRYNPSCSFDGELMSVFDVAERKNSTKIIELLRGLI